jgi:hypothetical protein
MVGDAQEHSLLKTFRDKIYTDIAMKFLHDSKDTFSYYDFMMFSGEEVMFQIRMTLQDQKFRASKSKFLKFFRELFQIYNNYKSIN